MLRFDWSTNQQALMKAEQQAKNSCGSVVTNMDLEQQLDEKQS